MYCECGDKVHIAAVHIFVLQSLKFLITTTSRLWDVFQLSADFQSQVCVWKKESNVPGSGQL